ncbi:hypothetical protein N7509_010441 [Penicillium cosmopolitanum]|uniref:BZIP domain-containing protein n=1 Tax=Penicillium cosmopolitanum TaxID=1131564 RepID=A0A9W9VRH4_9EURO|nr:uncharacterized protein N7509_010441 [Penicillium cosmopolitanum]KAJ5387900.1 hypothetical protein N7509_010441 [Penicillium cosmopolitanum]
MSTFTWAIPSRSGAGSTKNDDPKRRRKIQNRLNQRARRSRLQQQNKQNGKVDDPPFRVHRWKLDDPEDTEPSPPESSVLTSASPRTNPSNLRLHNSISHSALIVPARRDQSAKSKSCIASDLLLTMIQRNVARAGYQNSNIILPAVAAFSATGEPQPLDRLLTVSSIVPITDGLPDMLVPTDLQRRIPHAIWINGIPCPKMRDNLIQWEYMIDSTEFLYDLMGNLLEPEVPCFRPSGSPIQLSALPMNHDLSLSGDEEDDYTASRHGMIVWGKPYLLDSWELTPAFVRKWGRLLEGCDELIRSSNRWRESRGEEKIRITELEY